VTGPSTARLFSAKTGPAFRIDFTGKIVGLDIFADPERLRRLDPLVLSD